MSRLPLTAVILAAGQGRRLEPITLSHSKAMTPILGKPITTMVIDNLRSLGFDRFVLVAGKDDGDLLDLADSIRNEGITIDTAIQSERLGTAHALMQARRFINEDFLLASCDNIYPEKCLRDMTETFLTHKPPAVIASFDIGPGDLDRCAGVRLDRECVLEIVEKPGEGSGPWDAVCKFFFIFNRGILDFLDELSLSPRGEYEVQEALQKFLKSSSSRARGVFVRDFLHLTTADDLIGIHRHFLSNDHAPGVSEDAVVEADAQIVAPVSIDRGARVKSGSTIGPFVYVGENAEVGEKALIEDSVIYAGAVIEPGSRIKKQIILPSKSST